MSLDLITAEDLLRQGGPRGCELWDGHAVVRDPCSGAAEAVGARVVVPLGVHVGERDLGWVFMSSQGFLIATDPDRLLASDGAYVSRARLRRVPERGFIRLAPDFCIEVRSPTDSWESTVSKCGVWIAHGVACVWALDPFTRTVAVFRQGLPVAVLRGSGTASADPALPGFSLAVASLFDGLSPES